MVEDSENAASASFEAGNSEQARNDIPHALAASVAIGEVIMEILD